MTVDQLDHKSAVMERLRATWEARIAPMVARKVADAHAHGLKALTEALKKTDDGRSTILAINRSPSFRAANSRLDELWEWLAGPSEVSLEGEIRDARESLYREASKLWWSLIPTNIKSRESEPPNKMQVRRVRSAAIHGYDLRKALQGPIETAKRTLKANLEQAARKSTSAQVEADILATWERTSTSSMLRTCVTLLNDSCEFADRAAGVDLIDPQFIDESPIDGDESSLGEAAK